VLRNLTKSDWQRLFDIPNDRIPEVLILRGTRNLRRQSEIYHRFFEDIVEVGSPNGLIEEVFIGRLAGANVAYASVYGSAMASEITHVFAVLGTKLVLQTGCCGAWADGVQPGDLFIPTRAFCGEGAAQYYVGSKPIVEPTLNVVPWIDQGQLQGLSLFTGSIYTTAALFAEGTTELEQWANQGWEAVDMETATTFAVAEHFGIHSASVLFVFDDPRGGEIVLNEADKDERRQRGNTGMTAATFSIIERFLQQRRA